MPPLSTPWMRIRGAPAGAPQRLAAAALAEAGVQQGLASASPSGAECLALANARRTAPTPARPLLSAPAPDFDRRPRGFHALRRAHGLRWRQLRRRCGASCSERGVGTAGSIAGSSCNAAAWRVCAAASPGAGAARRGATALDPRHVRLGIAEQERSSGYAATTVGSSSISWSGGFLGVGTALVERDVRDDRVLVVDRGQRFDRRCILDAGSLLLGLSGILGLIDAGQRSRLDSWRRRGADACR